MGETPENTDWHGAAVGGLVNSETRLQLSRTAENSRLESRAAVFKSCDLKLFFF